MKVGMFWGSDTGATEAVADIIVNYLSPDLNVESIEISRTNTDKISEFEWLILGLSTWHDGELQSDWDIFFNKFCEINFSGKTVALFGLGDQAGYSDYFIDGVGIIAKQVLQAGGKIIGKWPTEGYDFDSSKASIDDFSFYGLAIDEEFQPELTDERIKIWCEQIKREFTAEIREEHSLD
tara:strand:+ start:512 stop:1051 length:540 start_codon:yes stop_codon:yes gene_type:complete